MVKLGGVGEHRSIPGRLSRGARSHAGETGASMKLAIVNLTAGGMSGGYTKYLSMLTPRLGALGVRGIRVFSPARLPWQSLDGIDIVSFQVSSWARPTAQLKRQIAEF